MPTPSKNNTGSAARGQRQLAGSRSTGTRARRAAQREAAADQPVATAPDQSNTESTGAKGKTKTHMERPSGLDPTIDASAGHRALEQQREPA